MNLVRQPELGVIIAKSGRGKTSQLIQLIDDRVEDGGRSIVILPDINEEAFYKYDTFIFAGELEDKFDINFTGVVCIQYEEAITFPFLWIKIQSGKMKMFSLVLDDPIYIERHPEEQINNIIERKRQTRYDIFVTAHSYDRIPRILFPFITFYGLGYTDGSIINRKKDLDPFYDVHYTKQMLVNAHCGTNENKKEFYDFTYFEKNGEPI